MYLCAVGCFKISARLPARILIGNPQTLSFGGDGSDGDGDGGGMFFEFSLCT